MATPTITYKAVIMPSQRRRDGSYNIKIRVTFKRVSRYISTNLTATPRDVSAKGEIKGSALIAANRLVSQFYQYSSELNFFALQEMSVDDVLHYIQSRASTGGSFKLDFFKYGVEVAKSKGVGTGGTYLTALNAFKRFLGTDEIDINDITYQMLYDFGKFLDNEPKQNRNRPALSPSKPPVIRQKKKGFARVGYTRKLKMIFLTAKQHYNDEDVGLINIPRNPFAKLDLSYYPEPVRTAKSPEWIQSIISFNGPCKPMQRLALDVYILSFALMGMNAVDLMTAPAAKRNVITYFRMKTKNRRPDRAEHRVLIDPRIKPLLDKYRDPDGKLLTNLYRRFRDNIALDGTLSRLFKTWADANGKEPFTLYSARHSWATIARSSKVGIDKALVNECLAHLDPDFKIADVYIEKDWNSLWEANKKVLDLFDWSNIANIAGR